MVGLPAVLMIGLPKIGKSTQSKQLQDYFPSVLSVQSSSILRQFSQVYPLDERSTSIRAMFETSAYLDDRTLISVITEYFLDVPRERVGCAILDGVIRTIPQAQAFSSLFDLREVWHFDDALVDESELVSIMLRTGRAVENTPEKALERIAIYKSSTIPLLAHYRDIGTPIVSFHPRPSLDERESVSRVFGVLASRVTSLLSSSASQNGLSLSQQDH